MRCMSSSAVVPFIPGHRIHAPARPDIAREFGELLPFVADPSVTDVFVSAERVWIDRGGGAEGQLLRMSEERVRELATRLIAIGGRHVDEATPCVDVRIGDGIRVHAALAPVSVTGTQLSIRLPAGESLSLSALERKGAFRNVGAVAIRELVDARINTLITGAGGSGKTTLLAAMLGEVPKAERIITIEDVAELRIDHPHVVAMQSRQANLEGAGEITLERLVREALRMRPDRLVLGECRGPEVREMLMALNTGHDGGAGTLHANSLDDVPARLEALGALAGLSPEAMGRQVVSAIGAVVHVERCEGWRGVAAIGKVVMRGGSLAIETQT